MDAAEPGALPFVRNAARGEMTTRSSAWRHPRGDASARRDRSDRGPAPCSDAFAHPRRTPLEAERRHVWMLRRNCALSPRQSLLSIGLLAALTLAVATPFAISGAWAVFACAIAEIVVIGGCFLLYARHAVDYDCIALTEHRLEVIQRCGAELRRYESNPLWATVELDNERDPRIRIRYRGEAASVGQHVTLAQRRCVVREVNLALAEMKRRMPRVDAARPERPPRDPA
ncbi:DUF2244 domain-containing protein [Burkholderia sp. MSMB617WGS]|uniref:DUF2244 domain-containing protein n=2 Tax=Burkholderiaceae TaxID=119060 RepID=UPI0009EBB171|nr:DUF2244 domain-containing protein [Burkholderia sp. MSMB617WGS]